MSTQPTDDPILELRLYSVAPGRLQDMEDRVQKDLRTLFPRHGVRPHGGWSMVSGPASPLFVYLTPWRNMMERSKCWAGFYSDPGWAEARTRTNAGSELVESYEIMFLRAVCDWAPAPTADCPIVEMVIQSVAIGQGPAVREEVLQTTLPTLEAAGATVFGAFDILSGRPLPSMVFFLGWRDMNQRAAALGRLDQRLSNTHVPGKAPLLGRAEQYLMRSVPVDWA
ncbi:MAG: NIPSNAP family protein [Rhodocyclaceae bacterium]|nr:NIPSNAP family protein [Rhodocyclaceae bacterium]